MSEMNGINYKLLRRPGTKFNIDQKKNCTMQNFMSFVVDISEHRSQVYLQVVLLKCLEKLELRIAGYRAPKHRTVDFRDPPR